MFVIVHNSSVILGPMRWNKNRFENVITEECEVTASLPSRNDSLSPIIVTDNVKILPIQGTPSPAFNSRIEFLNGPFWEFTDSAAIMSYRVESLSVDAVKNTLKAECAAERWRRENNGVKITIQGLEVTVDTSRGNRDIFVQKFLLMADSDTVQWKFPEGWLALSKLELGAIVNAAAAHVQTQFDWEANKISEIDNCATLEQLDAIVIVDPVKLPGV